jgi:hypothetical protein
MWRYLGAIERASLVEMVECADAWLHKNARLGVYFSISLARKRISLALDKHLVSDHWSDDVLSESLLLEQL